MGVMVPANPGVKVTISIKAYITESLPAVRTLPTSQRNCYFSDEIELGLAAQYSQRSCYIECRLDYLRQVCGCRPYYFNMLGKKAFQTYHQKLYFSLLGGILNFIKYPVSLTQNISEIKII